MGENKHIEELDIFAKKYIKEIKEESPSTDFTANIMNAILETKKADIYKATPLISKKVWFLLSAVLVTSILYVSRGTSLGWVKMPKVNLNFTDAIQLPKLFEGITISNTILYTCFLFTLMIFVQIYFLKGYFTRKINM
ncbi:MULTISPECIES: hypothetical protein [Tenacibaculum]|uniref:hypothetical protein n=1 Tax=Tenacibaculum TaxID=104267 RepID=UPI0008994339|nr:MULTISPECIES: hypothetical protein [unclassified Tenacibaculum]RBW55802.1 hypothetical protein DS884_15745 [Tenacibaculum sp. E3R01]SEE63197.1 hypothetical protein SAMN04487765_3483 [Tenacibaculum sp. MAR_2010_89]